MSRRDGGLLHGQGSGYRIGRTPALPGFEIAAEDYRRLARLALTDSSPTLELASEIRFHDDDPNAYNILADLPGTDPKAGYVMAGAHLDSWAAGDGAADNAAGSAVVMEAARILSRLGVRPKRTIRFALWAAEEQGLLGSLAYVERHIGTRPPAEERYRHLRPGQTWRHRWPLTLKPGHRDMVAYFNLDNGSGKIRGIQAEGNVAAVPIFKEWLAPFASLGARDGGDPSHGEHRPRLFPAGRPSRLPVHPGPARLRQPASPHQHGHLRPSEGRRPSPGGGDHGRLPPQRRQSRRAAAANAGALAAPADGSVRISGGGLRLSPGRAAGRRKRAAACRPDRRLPLLKRDKRRYHDCSKGDVMRLAIAALALTLPAASSALPAPSPARPAASQAQAWAPARTAAAVPSRICRDDMKPRHANSPGAANPRRLGELPGGDLTLAVVNQVGDCIEPVVVRQGYGAVDDRPVR